MRKQTSENKEKFKDKMDVMETSKKELEKLKKENAAFRTKLEALNKNCRNLRINNMRLETSNGNQDEYYKQLKNHHDRCVQDNERLIEVEREYKGKIGELEEMLELRTSYAMAEHRTKLAYRRIVMTFVDKVDQSQRDEVLSLKLHEYLEQVEPFEAKADEPIPFQHASTERGETTKTPTKRQKPKAKAVTPKDKAASSDSSSDSSDDSDSEEEEKSPKPISKSQTRAKTPAANPPVTVKKASPKDDSSDSSQSSDSSDNKKQKTQQKPTAKRPPVPPGKKTKTPPIDSSSSDSSSSSSEEGTNRVNAKSKAAVLKDRQPKKVATPVPRENRSNSIKDKNAVVKKTADPVVKKPVLKKKATTQSSSSSSSSSSDSSSSDSSDSSDDEGINRQPMKPISAKTKQVRPAPKRTTKTTVSGGSSDSSDSSAGKQKRARAVATARRRALSAKKREQNESSNSSDSETDQRPKHRPRGKSAPAVALSPAIPNARTRSAVSPLSPSSPLNLPSDTDSTDSEYATDRTPIQQRNAAPKMAKLLSTAPPPREIERKKSMKLYSSEESDGWSSGDSDTS
uniref:Uncharacterized protein n=1 Tax=Entomoneis paludosa TaxID=265537 RepID=A0A7S2YDA2_9STRA|mmetsp:Transcript_28226/g.59058  ORF Transcript_28226/g.59058 Transcript_28226/m.59058 type:complete len:570 (+) Transcript_28226:977-2686(+)